MFEVFTMRKSATVLFSVIYSFSAGWAQSSNEKSYDGIFAVIDHRNVEQLGKLLEDKSIITPIKVKAVEKVGSIYRSNPQLAESKSDQMIGILEKAIQENQPQDGIANESHLIRASACLNLSSFDKSRGASKAINTVIKTFESDKNVEVISACGKSLGFFQQNQKTANDALLKKLEGLLKKEILENTDGGIVMSIANAINRLESIDAYLPMLHILDSGYPLHVKQEAERTLDVLEIAMRRESGPK